MTSSRSLLQIPHILPTTSAKGSSCSKWWLQYYLGNVTFTITWRDTRMRCDGAAWFIVFQVMACGVILAPCISAACLSHAVDAPCRPFKGFLLASCVYFSFISFLAQFEPTCYPWKITEHKLKFSFWVFFFVLQQSNNWNLLNMIFSLLKIPHSTIVCSTTEAILSCKMKASAGLHWNMSMHSNFWPAVKGKT